MSENFQLHLLKCCYFKYYYNNTNIEVHKAKASIKRTAITTNDTCQQNLGAELQNISADAAAATLPALKYIERNIS